MSWFLILLSGVFVVLKLAAVITWPWWVVLAPAGLAVLIAVGGILLVIIGGIFIARKMD